MGEWFAGPGVGAGRGVGVAGAGIAEGREQGDAPGLVGLGRSGGKVLAVSRWCGRHKRTPPRYAVAGDDKAGLSVKSRNIS